MRGSDPFERPLDRHLEAQRRGFGPDAYRLRLDLGATYAYEGTCPRCCSPGRTVSLVELGGHGGPIRFGSCSQGCNTAKVAASAQSLEEFIVDGRDDPLLPLRHDGFEWSVKLPLAEFLEMVGEAP